MRPELVVGFGNSSERSGICDVVGIDFLQLNIIQKLNRITSDEDLIGARHIANTLCAVVAAINQVLF